MASEIRLEQLDNGPGLLPFKLGPTKLITQYHSFIQYIELTDIENQLDSIYSQINNFRTQLNNYTLPVFELQIDYLNTKLIKITSQLKSLEPNRIKRGLVDGLGSFIKSITGNLDQSDAEKYNKAIKMLENNNEKLITEINSHISLNKEWTSQYTQIISNIVDNQQKINETLNLILDKNNLSEIRFAKFAQLLAIITENVDDLYLELVRLENTLAFIRASSTHHSMLSIDNLEKMIIRLKNIYNDNKIVDADLRDYYNIIKPGSYFIDKRIVVIFKFPIISPNDFDLYRLAIVPNKAHQTFIPPYPLMATDGRLFMYMEAECPKFSRYLLCEETTNHLLREQPDCIQNIVINQALDESCRPMTISFTKEAMEQLDERHYTLVFPQPTKVELRCDRQEFVSLLGSYLATIPADCSLRTNEMIITNINDEIRGQPLKITEVSNDYNLKPGESPHITLNTINLKSLHHLEDRILVQTPIQLDHIDTAPLYHTTIPLYLIILGAAVLALSITLQRYMQRKKTRGTAEGKGKEHIYAVPEETIAQEPVPATFSLKVLK